MSESRRHFERLRENYAGSLAHKRRSLARAWSAFAVNPHEGAVRRDLFTQIHRLCGSAPAYGYERLGDQARVADELMREWEALPPPQRAAPADLAARLAAPVRAVLDELDRTGAPGADTDATSLCIVLVEDDPSQAVLIGAELEARGCLVRLASSAETLWQILQQWPCHAIVLDYWLRGETAAEIAAMLRREPGCARTALVCFSVEHEPQVLRAALEAGCDAALGKAEGAGRLLEVVRACVARPDRSGLEFHPPP
ncbi:response regulator [Dokdonella soli]